MLSDEMLPGLGGEEGFEVRNHQPKYREPRDRTASESMSSTSSAHAPEPPEQPGEEEQPQEEQPQEEQPLEEQPQEEQHQEEHPEEEQIEEQQQYEEETTGADADVVDDIQYEEEVMTAESNTDSDDDHPLYAGGNSDDNWELYLDLSTSAVRLRQSSPTMDETTNTGILLIRLTREQYLNFGQRLDDKEMSEYEDDCIHCELCECYYRAGCHLHPVYWVADRDVPPSNAKSCEHAKRTLPAFCSIHTSHIPGAGLGVFADADMPIGLVFGPYQGILTEDGKEADKSGYAWQLRYEKDGKAMHTYIDGRDPRASNWMRYINSARFDEEQNMVAFQYQGSVYYRVIREVSTGDELLVWYGGDFKFGSQSGSKAHSCSRGGDGNRAPQRGGGSSIKKNPFIWS